MKRTVVALMLTLSGCFPFDDGDNWADRDQIVDAAKRCGVDNFEPTQVGDGWAAYVPNYIVGAPEKENCIYGDLRRHGFLVTR